MHFFLVSQSRRERQTQSSKVSQKDNPPRRAIRASAFTLSHRVLDAHRSVSVKSGYTLETLPGLAEVVHSKIITTGLDLLEIMCSSRSRHKGGQRSDYITLVLTQTPFGRLLVHLHLCCDEVNVGLRQGQGQEKKKDEGSVTQFAAAGGATHARVGEVHPGRAHLLDFDGCQLPLTGQLRLTVDLHLCSEARDSLRCLC